MSCTTTTYFVNHMRQFPAIVDGKINLVKFLEATEDLVCLVERLGKALAPVRYDIQGNISKVKKYYEFDDNSCLLEIMLDEKNCGKYNGTESILWLNRTFLFFELVFQEILICLQSNNYDINMKEIYKVAYECSVKKYHNWVTQKLFGFICKMSPTFKETMKSLDVENNDIKTFELDLSNFTIKLHLIRSKIDDFFKDNDLFPECI